MHLVKFTLFSKKMVYWCASLFLKASRMSALHTNDAQPLLEAEGDKPAGGKVGTYLLMVFL
jgi:hypothetical protein